MKCTPWPKPHQTPVHFLAREVFSKITFRSWLVWIEDGFLEHDLSRDRNVPNPFFFRVLVDRSSASCLATRPSGQVSAAFFDLCSPAAMSGLLVQVSLGQQGG